MAGVNGSRITLTGDSALSIASAAGLSQQGSFTVPGGDTAVNFQESYTVAQMGAAIASAVNGAGIGVTASYANDRITFGGATQATSTFPLQNLPGNVYSPFISQNDNVSGSPADTGVLAGDVQVKFGAGDSASTIGASLAAAINGQTGLGVTATANNGQVVLTAATAPTITFSPAATTLAFSGAGAGGTITGMADVGGTLYAVSSGGSLYTINPNATGKNIASLVTTVTNFGAPISFSGLTAGPPDVEGGAYANMLFATDSQGNVYALSTTGVLQPIFSNGATSVATGITGLTGVAFSTLDYNLWHISSTGQSTDTGNSVNPSPDNVTSRGTTTTTTTTTPTANTDYYFGLDSGYQTPVPGQAQPGAAAYATNPSVYQTINLPGGATGQLTTGTFSLADYSTGDLPTLYFDYYLNTDSPASNAATDTFRVYISANGGGSWNEIATNNSLVNTAAATAAPNGELPATITAEGGTYLGEAADQNVQPLFNNTGTWRKARIDLGDYAGDSNLELAFDFSSAGSMSIGNVQTAGSTITAEPGYLLTNNDQVTVSGATEQFNLGYVLDTIDGGDLSNNSTFTVTGAAGSVTFQMTTSGSATAGNIAIPYSVTDSAATVAAEIQAAIDTNSAKTGVTALIYDNRVELLPAAAGALATLTLGAGAGLSLETAPTGNVAITFNSTASDVALALADAINYSLVPSAGPTPSILTAVKLVSPAPAAGDTGITFSSTDSAATVAAEIAAAINGDTALGITAKVTNGTDVTLSGGATTFALNSGSGLALGPNSPPTVIDVTGSVSTGTTFTITTAKDPTGAIFEMLSGATTIDVIGNTIDSSTLPYSNSLPGDQFGVAGTKNSALANQNNNYEGVYLDDLIVGLAGRGEMVTDAPANTTTAFSTPLPKGSAKQVYSGDYQLEIQRGSEYATPSMSNGSTTGGITLAETFDINARLTAAFSLTASSGANTVNGQTFTISNGLTTQTFQFSTSGSAAAGIIAIPFNVNETAGQVAANMAAAINSAGFSVSATQVGSGAIVDLFNAVQVLGSSTSITASAGSSITDYQTFQLQGTNTTTTFQFLLSGQKTTSTAYIGIQYSTSDSATTVAQEIAAAINGAGQGATASTSSGVVSVSNVEQISGFNYLAAPSGASIVDGSVFEIGDGTNTVYFQFLSALDVTVPALPAWVPNSATVYYVVYNPSDSSATVAQEIADTIAGSGLAVTANPENDIVALTGQQFVNWQGLIYAPGGSTQITLYQYNALDGIPLYGDTLNVGTQGYTLIQDNTITNSLDYGIYEGPGARASADNPAAGGVRNLPTTDSGNLVPGIAIENNVLANNVQGGIKFAGDPGNLSFTAPAGSGVTDGETFTVSDGTKTVTFEFLIVVTLTAGDTGIKITGTENADQIAQDIANAINASGLNVTVSLDGPYVQVNGAASISNFTTTSGTAGAVPFGRIVNNTIYGGATARGVGIDIIGAASPTVLNNIVANSATGIYVDGSSNAAGTVLGYNLFQGNTANGSIGTSAITLAPSAPLFVDPSAGDFYLAEGSKAIDAAQNSLQDRPTMVAVENTLGITTSNILAPSTDRNGVSRVEDLNVTHSPGSGQNAYVDIGAIERADFVGPGASLVTPAANGQTSVTVSGSSVPSTFQIQLSDGSGVGVNNATVSASDFTITLNGATLVSPTNYIYTFNTNTETATFTPATGVWAAGAYVITLNNSPTGIADLAGNALRANNSTTGATTFTITVGSGSSGGGGSGSGSTSSWQNPTNKYDVNHDGVVGPIDALVLIEAINNDLFPTNVLPLPAPSPPPDYYDVNGDGLLSATDVLLEIQYLNVQPPTSSNPAVATTATSTPVMAFAAASGNSSSAASAPASDSAVSSPAVSNPVTSNSVASTATVGLVSISTAAPTSASASFSSNAWVAAVAQYHSTSDSDSAATTNASSAARSAPNSTVSLSMFLGSDTDGEDADGLDTIAADVAAARTVKTS